MTALGNGTVAAKLTDATSRACFACSSCLEKSLGLRTNSFHYVWTKVSGGVLALSKMGELATHLGRAISGYLGEYGQVGRFPVPV
jgi:hypothetical protein